MGTHGDITYTLENTQFFKGTFRDGDEISFTTAGQSAACGTYLELDEVQYLMGLSLRNGIYTADFCGLHEDWGTVSDDDKASVKAGCANDLCDVTCHKFQVQHGEMFSKRWRVYVHALCGLAGNRALCSSASGSFSYDGLSGFGAGGHRGAASQRVGRRTASAVADFERAVGWWDHIIEPCHFTVGEGKRAALYPGMQP